MKPINLSTEMVKAITTGQKTQTRRPIKNIKLEEKNDFISAIVDRKHNHISWAGHKKLFIRDFSPFQVGDVLYVRETWQENYCYDCDNEMCHSLKGKCIVYKADRKDGYREEGWRPSIHMPKEAARIFIQVKNVSFEKVRDITTQDLIKEGFGNCGHAVDTPWYAEAKKEFEKCWKNIYGEQSWENGYAWVYEFERISKEDAYGTI